MKKRLSLLTSANVTLLWIVGFALSLWGLKLDFWDGNIEYKQFMMASYTLFAAAYFLARNYRVVLLMLALLPFIVVHYGQ